MDPAATAATAARAPDAPAPPTPTPAVPSEPPKPKVQLSDPGDMVTGESLPIEPHTFKTTRGKEITILLQGLPYVIKSRIDAMQTIYWQECQRSGEFTSNMYSARLIAAAARKPNGIPAYMDDDAQEKFAILIAGEWSDGELIRGGNHVLDLSGYGGEADKAVGKSSTTTPTSS